MRSVNRRRGEVAAELDGKAFRLCLTLNALAELEDAFAAENLSALVERFGSGRLSARDMMRIVGAGLRGAGESVTDEAVGAMQVAGGAAGWARIVADLLGATFGSAGEEKAAAIPAAGEAATNPAAGEAAPNP